MGGRILISACLLGCRCRYDGCAKANPAALELAGRYEVTPVCPEQLGGLATPRPPAERRGDRVITAEGAEGTDAYRRGAEETLRLAELLGCGTAVLKERSPSCGCGTIYDGTFTHTPVLGDGVTAELLTRSGIRVLGESDIRRVLLE